MEIKTTEQVIKDVMKMITKHGINNYVLVVECPDEGSTESMAGGSPHWRYGVGENIKMHARETMMPFEEDLSD